MMPRGRNKQPISKRKQKLLRKQNKKKAKMQLLQKAADYKSRKLMKYSLDFGPDNDEKLKSRSARFQSQLETPYKSKPIEINRLNYNTDLTELDWDEMTVIGTSQDLEKKYLRLTKRPEANTIRPLNILKKSLELVKEKWAENHDYHYTCEQMKSIRQDLTIQCIRNEFTVKVYETHARFALEKTDHQEFNQCQTQLKALYKDNKSSNKCEFTAYEIVYNIFVNNTLELSSILGRISKKDRDDDNIKYAMKLRSAWTLDNFYAFFELYKDPPAMTGFLIDWFSDRLRSSAMNHILKAYRPSVEINYIADLLNFKDNEDCLEYLKKASYTMTSDNTKVDTKLSISSIKAAAEAN